MKTVTITKLRTILAGLSHATPIGLITMTDARCRKTDLPFTEVRKLTRLNVMVGALHEAAVRRQQEREGQEATFTAKPRKWGVHIPGTPLVEHNGVYYLAAQLNPVQRPKPLYLVPSQRGNRTILKAVPKEVVAPWLPAERDEAAYQGVERAVVHRDFRLDSIVSATIDGVRYRVRA